LYLQGRASDIKAGILVSVPSGCKVGTQRVGNNDGNEAFAQNCDLEFLNRVWMKLYLGYNRR
jgi:hypothetical protein